jgi:hypothetical protein
MHHGKRRKLSTVDIDYALVAKNVEVSCPFFSLQFSTDIPWFIDDQV